MQIPIPDSLRKQIEAALAQLDADTQTDASKRSELSGKIAEYEAEQKRCRAELTALEGQILQTPKAANKIPGLRLRLQALGEALAESRQELEKMGPVGFGDALEAFREVIRHWMVTFPPIFAEHVRDSFRTEQNALGAAKLTDVPRALGQLRNDVEYGISSRAQRVEVIQGVLRRALIGRPYLGLSCPLDESAQNPSPAAETAAETSKEAAASHPAPSPDLAAGAGVAMATSAQNTSPAILAPAGEPAAGTSAEPAASSTAAPILSP